jgi:chromosome partitioning protein
MSALNSLYHTMAISPAATHPELTGQVATALTIAIAHNKGGVGKTTSTVALGRLLSRSLRVEMVDMDDTRYLREMVAALCPKGDFRLGPRLWLRNGETRPCDVVLLDSAPARGHATRAALQLADYVLVPAPPEPMGLLGLQFMFRIIDEVRTDRHEGNPFLQILGVQPTLFDQRWPNHHGWVEEMREFCASRNVLMFPPIPRRQSYTSLSIAGHDYDPAANAIAEALRMHRLGAEAVDG